MPIKVAYRYGGFSSESKSKVDSFISFLVFLEGFFFGFSDFSSSRSDEDDGSIQVGGGSRHCSVLSTTRLGDEKAGERSAFEEL